METLQEPPRGWVVIVVVGDYSGGEVGTVPSGIGCHPPLSERRSRLYAGMDVVVLLQKIV